jgi:hypothetical protein
MYIRLVGFAFALPYRVLRCSTGRQVTLLGNEPSHEFLRSTPSA